MSFSDLKRKSQNNFQILQKELEKSSTESKTDERFWKPVLNEGGNGYAVIRFLPAPEGETIPWAKVYSHAFQDVGGWYIENSLTTIGQNDPVGELNRRLWNNGSDADKEVARKQKRKLSYYSNIYVVKDPANPDNEGKVFLYRYGKKIYDKILASMQPEFQDEQPVNVFDLWEGANFKLKIKTVGGYWNYDSSEFAPSTALSVDDEELEKIWKQEYSLEAFTAPDQFKTYEELQQRLDVVLGKVKQRSSVDPEVADEDDEGDYSPIGGDTVLSGVSSSPKVSAEEEDAFSYFQSLSQDF